MEKKNSKVSVFDLQGLFCGWLDRKLQGGELTRCFIADMVKRGVLSDKDETILVAARQQIDFMVHGDKDYFKHHIALKRKETTMNSVCLLSKMLAKEDAERQRESVNENVWIVLQVGTATSVWNLKRIECVCALPLL